MQEFWKMKLDVTFSSFFQYDSLTSIA